MKALQYIYTSWKNGDSLEKGYMIYSKSSGITDIECDCIKEIMHYMPPRDLKINPTPEEIADEFPYNFAYFILPSGRLCVASTTYLGKDYSGRFGNYIIYALVFENDELTAYPVELFAEPYIKTYMTDEELNALPPIQPLPALDIDEYGEIINDDVISDFISEREEDFAYLISAILEGIRMKRPVYINDTRENLVLWMSGVQKMLPLEIAKNFSFSTYISNHENFRMNQKLNLLCMGVRPDANYFDYRQEKESSRHIVLDFSNNIKTNDIRVSDYALKMSEYIADSLEELSRFKTFLDTSEYSTLDEKIIIAFEFYKILEEDNVKIDSDILLDIINFGKSFCNISDNSVVAAKMLNDFQKELPDIAIEDMKIVFSYLFQYVGHMLSSIYGVLYDIIFQSVETMTLEETLSIRDFFESCKEGLGLFINGYLDYFISEEGINTAELYLKDNRNQVVIQYYLIFILENYDLSQRTNSNKFLFGLLHNLMHNLFKLDNATKNVLAVMEQLVVNTLCYLQIMSDYRKTLTNMREFDIFYSKVVEQLYSLDMDEYGKVERLMIQIPEYNQVATELFLKRIELSKIPEDDFEYYIKKISSEDINSSIKLAPLINTYLKAVKNEKRFNAVMKLFKRLDEKDICSSDLLNTMVEIIESKGFKQIAKLDKELLKYIHSLCKKCNVRDDIIYSILYGESLAKLVSGTIRKNDLTRKLRDNNLNLSKLSKKDYKMYLDKYIESVFDSIKDDDILGIVLNQLYHESYSEILFSSYINYLKSLEKKKEKVWENSVLYACRYTIINISDHIPKLFEPYLIAYLHKAKKDEISILEKLLESEKLGLYSKTFFDKVREGEKKKGIFFGLFKKN